MAEPLRRTEDFKLDEFPESPNMNAVPPPAPFGSADRSTTAGAAERGESLLHGDEVDVANRPRHLLEPYSEERERSWPLGKIPSSVRNGSLMRDIQDRAEEVKVRLADWADDAQHQVSLMSDRFRYNLSDWQERAQRMSQDVVHRSRERIEITRTQAERFVDERPAHALAIIAGAGFLLGVLLRLGRSRREY